MATPREIWDTRMREGRWTVFSSGVEGVPTLDTMREIEKEFVLEVQHMGFGCFRAMHHATGEEAFAFDAGGLMTREGDFSWGVFGATTLAWQRKIRSWLRLHFHDLPVTEGEATGRKT